MKKILMFWLITILTLLISVDVMGAIHPNEEITLTDTWYSLNPPSNPHYKVYSYVPYTNKICINSEFYINDQSFVIMNLSDESTDVTTNIRASSLFPGGIFVGIEANYGTTGGKTLGSLGYRLNLNDRGYLAISVDSAQDLEINGSGIVYDLDGEYLSDSYKISGEIRFVNNGKITGDLQGRIKVNDNIIGGLDLDISNEDYFIGLTWNQFSFMIFDGKIGISSNNLKFSLNETFKLGNHSIGLEFEKLESEEDHQFTLKEKYLISNISQLIIKIGFGGPFFEKSPYEPLVLVAYQMNF